jgi:uncharacterized protein YijF (DUF1287 family)
MTRLAVLHLPILILLVPSAWANSADIVAAAREQIGITIHYDPAYRKLSFPGGDVPADRGVCTDVVVRALRVSRGYDLQQRVNADLRANWDAYPHPWKWRLSKPDSNIDHRRVPNLMKYFERAGHAQPVTRAPGDYLPGDIVAWDLGRGILHIGIVGDVTSEDGARYVIHNIGAGAREEDILFRYRIIGHYRLPAAVVTP